VPSVICWPHHILHVSKIMVKSNYSRFDVVFCPHFQYYRTTSADIPLALPQYCTQTVCNRIQNQCAVSATRKNSWSLSAPLREPQTSHELLSATNHLLPDIFPHVPKLFWCSKHETCSAQLHVLSEKLLHTWGIVFVLDLSNWIAGIWVFL
jgi:hypothetical protein